ncbi:hypothetical protein M9458_025138, partial [Cirrhinus mrigala]
VYSNGRILVWAGRSTPLCHARADPNWTLEKYINFALWIVGSAITMGKSESSPDSSPAMAASPESSPVMATRPEPSQQPPSCTERLLEPTDDGEPKPAAIDEPSPPRATDLRIKLEPEP